MSVTEIVSIVTLSEILLVVTFSEFVLPRVATLLKIREKLTHILAERRVLFGLHKNQLSCR